MVSVSSEPRTITSGASSRRESATGRGTSRGETPTEDLFFDIEANFSGEEEIYSSARMRDLRPRFPVHQAKANTYIKVVDGGIRDTQTSV